MSTTLIPTCLHPVGFFHTNYTPPSARYPNAIEDGRTSLKYKLELYPEDSEIIAEAHYKLSLALEFASVTTTGEGGETSKREAMDQGLRDDAAKEMELAIKSFRLKMQNKEVELATMASPEDNELARRSIVEMKELIVDMEQRVRKPHLKLTLAEVKWGELDALTRSSNDYSWLTFVMTPSTRRVSLVRMRTRLAASWGLFLASHRPKPRPGLMRLARLLRT